MIATGITIGTNGMRTLITIAFLSSATVSGGDFIHRIIILITPRTTIRTITTGLTRTTTLVIPMIITAATTHTMITRITTTMTRPTLFLINTRVIQAERGAVGACEAWLL